MLVCKMGEMKKFFERPTRRMRGFVKGVNKMRNFPFIMCIICAIFAMVGATNHWWGLTTYGALATLAWCTDSLCEAIKGRGQ